MPDWLARARVGFTADPGVFRSVDRQSLLTGSLFMRLLPR